MLETCTREPGLCSSRTGTRGLALSLADGDTVRPGAVSCVGPLVAAASGSGTRSQVVSLETE